MSRDNIVVELELDHVLAALEAPADAAVQDMCFPSDGAGYEHRPAVRAAFRRAFAKAAAEHDVANLENRGRAYLRACGLVKP